MTDQSPPTTNRLSIGLLLLWTTTTAAVMAFLQTMMPLPEFPSGGYRGDWAFAVILLCATPAYGAAIAGVVLAAWRLIWRRPGFPTEPGHWLLIVLGAMTLGIPFVGKLGASMNRSLAELAPFTLLILVTLLVGAAAWQSRQQHWGWAWLLSIIGLVLLAVAIMVPRGAGNQELLILSIVAAWVGLLAAPLAILAAACIDLALRHRRDTLHWVGIITMICLIAQPVMVWLVDFLLL